MPKHGGHDYHAMYYNNEGKINTKRKKGRLAKATPAETLEFIENSMTHFKEKHGKKVKSIRMSQELKDMIDGRTKGKNFLKKIELVVVTKEPLGFRTIYLSELGEKKK